MMPDSCVAFSRLSSTGDVVRGLQSGGSAGE